MSVTLQSQSIEYRYTVNHCIEISLQQEDGEKLCNFHYNLPSSDRNTFDSRSRYSSLSPSRRGIDWHRIDSHWSWPRALTPWIGRRPIVARFAAPRLVTPTRTSRRGGTRLGAWRSGLASPRCTKLPSGSELIASSSHPKTLSGASARRMPKWQV